MSVVSLKEVLGPAFEKRYGVGAFNIVDDLTMMAVLDAAAETRSPVIIQVSVKTVKFWGARLIQADICGTRFPTADPGHASSRSLSGRCHDQNLSGSRLEFSPL